jgi:hypothetical protein
MSFGKRNAPPAGEAAPLSPGFRNVPSASVDEPSAPPSIPQVPAASYMPLDSYRVRERFDGSRARLAARHEEKSCDAKARFARAEVRPFCLIPETFWSGKSAELLSSRLDLFPYDDWNVAFLAADEASAALLGLPSHPGAVSSATTADVGKLLAAAELQLTTGYANAERARNFSQYAQEREEVRDRLTIFARKVLFALDEGWQKSKLEPAD